MLFFPEGTVYHGITSLTECDRYNAFAGIADLSNSFFIAPVVHFPWSEKGRAMRGKTDKADGENAV